MLDDNGVRLMPGAAYREFNFGLGETIDAVRDQVRRVMLAKPR